MKPVLGQKAVEGGNRGDEAGGGSQGQIQQAITYPGRNWDLPLEAVGKGPVANLIAAAGCRVDCQAQMEMGADSAGRDLEQWMGLN